MENSIQKVWHKQFGSLRMVLLNGTVYCVGKDAAQALLFKDTDKAIRRHVQSQDKITFPTNVQFENRGGVKIPQGAILINESGLNSLVMKSKVPFASNLRSWLTNSDKPDIFYRVHAQLISKYVYVLEMDDGTVKIGIAQNVNQRIKAIQRENGTQVSRRYNSKVIDEKLAAEIESKCHATFEEKRAHGEYFNITFDEGCAELDKYAEEIDAANAEIEKLINLDVTPPEALPLIEDFTRREKVEILLKLLNMTPPPALKNHLIKQVSFLLDDEYDNLMEKLNGELEQIAE